MLISGLKRQQNPFQLVASFVHPGFSTNVPNPENLHDLYKSWQACVSKCFMCESANHKNKTLLRLSRFIHVSHSHLCRPHSGYVCQTNTRNEKGNSKDAWGRFFQHGVPKKIMELKAVSHPKAWIVFRITLLLFRCFRYWVKFQCFWYNAASAKPSYLASISIFSECTLCFNVGQGFSQD